MAFCRESRTGAPGVLGSSPSSARHAPLRPVAFPRMPSGQARRPVGLFADAISNLGDTGEDPSLQAPSVLSADAGRPFAIGIKSTGLAEPKRPPWTSPAPTCTQTLSHADRFPAGLLSLSACGLFARHRANPHPHVLFVLIHVPSFLRSLPRPWIWCPISQKIA